jgi:hypothetical protein
MIRVLPVDIHVLLELSGAVGCRLNTHAAPAIAAF